MVSHINEIAKEIVDSRDIELVDKLLKIKEIVHHSEDPGKIKFEIYKCGLLEALSVSFKSEHGFIQDGWKKAVELVKLFW
jgi:hypothetical protein